MRAVPHLNGTKVEAIDRAKVEGISTVLASEYNVSRVTLYRWVQSEDAIRAAPPSKTFAVATKRGPEVLFPAMEEM